MAEIRSRRSWGAARPRPRSLQNPLNVAELFVHWNGSVPASFKHINTVAEEEALMRSTQAFHMGPQRGWSDFAYSFAIMPSGRIYRGRGMKWVPAAQANHNSNTNAVIVFLGPDDPVPAAVVDAIKSLHRHVNRRSLRNVRLRAHRDVTGTECPGPRLTALVRKLAS